MSQVAAPRVTPANPTTAVVRTELRRAARSRGLRTVLVVAAVATVLLGYLAVRALLGLVADGSTPGDGVTERMAELDPARVRTGMAGVVTGTLPALALLTGGLVVRSDHRGHLLRLLLARGVRRRDVAIGKVLALVGVAVVAAVVTTGAALASAVVLADRTRPLPPPSVWDLAVLLGVGTASWLSWSLLGLLVAVLARSAAAAVVLAAAWTLASGPLSTLAARDDAVGALVRLGPASAAREALLGSPSAGALATVLLVPVLVAVLCVAAVVRGRVD